MISPHSPFAIRHLFRAEWEVQQEVIDDNNALMDAEKSMDTVPSVAKDELSEMNAKEAKQREQRNAAFTKRGMKYLGMLSLEEINTASEVPHFLHIDLDPFQSRRWMVEVNEGTSVVGRKAGEIKLFSTKVRGAEHAKIVRTGDTVRVVALNGPTWVNGRKVAPCDPVTLQPNDRVSLGGEVLLFRMPGAIDAPYRVLATDGTAGDDDGMVPNVSGVMEDGDMSYEAEEPMPAGLPGDGDYLIDLKFHWVVRNTLAPKRLRYVPKMNVLGAVYIFLNWRRSRRSSFARSSGAAISSSRFRWGRRTLSPTPRVTHHPSLSRSSTHPPRLRWSSPLMSSTLPFCRSVVATRWL